MGRQLLTIPQLEKDVAVYLAGLIDGEGTFYISTYLKNSGSRASMCYTPSFKLVLTDEKTIAWAAKQLNFSYTHILANPGKNHKDTYAIRIGATKNLVEFIPQILPYMITKQETARIMLAFCESRLINRHKFQYNQQSYSELEVGFAKQIKSLNRVGIIAGGYEN